MPGRKGVSGENADELFASGDVLRLLFVDSLDHEPAAQSDNVWVL